MLPRVLRFRSRSRSGACPGGDCLRVRAAVASLGIALLGADVASASSVTQWAIPTPKLSPSIGGALAADARAAYIATGSPADNNPVLLRVDTRGKITTVRAGFTSGQFSPADNPLPSLIPLPRRLIADGRGGWWFSLVPGNSGLLLDSRSGSRLVHVDRSRAVTEHNLGYVIPEDLVVQPSGAVWFARRVPVQAYGDSPNVSPIESLSLPLEDISGAVATDGSVVVKPAPADDITNPLAMNQNLTPVWPGAAVLGPDGTPWFTISWGPKPGIYRARGSSMEFVSGWFKIRNRRVGPRQLVRGSDGAVWYRAFFSRADCRLVRVANSGATRRFVLPAAACHPDMQHLLAAGSNDAVWFGLGTFGKPRLGRITSNGKFTSFDVPLFPGARSARLSQLQPEAARRVWFSVSPHSDTKGNYEGPGGVQAAVGYIRTDLGERSMPRVPFRDYPAGK